MDNSLDRASSRGEYLKQTASCLKIQFSTKILSPRRGCGRVGVASGPGNFSWEVGNYASPLLKTTTLFFLFFAFLFFIYWVSEACPTLTSTIESKIRVRGYIYMSRNMRGTLLRAVPRIA